MASLLSARATTRAVLPALLGALGAWSIVAPAAAARPARVTTPHDSTLRRAPDTASGAPLVRPRYGDVFTAFRTERLAEGVYAFISPDSRSAFVSGNSLLVVGDTAALVVDAGHFPSLTRRIIAEVRRLTKKPVRTLVNTHWHEDHLGGNADYAAAFPGLRIVSTNATRDTIRTKVPAMIADEVQSYPGYLKQLRAILAKGTRPDGSAIPPFSLAYNRNEADDLERAIAELATVKVTPPTVGFDREMTVDLGGRSVKLLWLGLGNTPGDAVAWVPDARVVATGDLVVAPTPYAFGSFIFEWPVTLRALMALPATAIVPGHGPVMRDWRYVTAVTTMLDSLGARMTRVVATGATLDSARRRIDLSAFRGQLAGDDPYLQRAFDSFFVESAVERAYEAARKRAAR